MSKLVLGDRHNRQGHESGVMDKNGTSLCKCTGAVDRTACRSQCVHTVAPAAAAPCNAVSSESLARFTECALTHKSKESKWYMFREVHTSDCKKCEHLFKQRTESSAPRSPPEGWRAAGSRRERTTASASTSGCLGPGGQQGRPSHCHDVLRGGQAHAAAAWVQMTHTE